MSEDPQDSLDLFDDHEEVVSEDGKKVTRKGIYLLPTINHSITFLRILFDSLSHKW